MKFSIQYQYPTQLSRITAGGPLAPKDENLNEIVERVRVMEKLVADAIEDDSSKMQEELIRQHNNELEGILMLLKSNFCENINQLLLLVEEERSLREELQAELDATKLRWKSDIQRTSESKTSVAQRQITTCESPTEAELLLMNRVAELEAECETLRAVIRNERPDQ